MKTYPARMSVCPRRGCVGAPLPIFCAECWAKISSETKRQLFRLWKIMGSSAGARPGHPPDGFMLLLEEAVHEINTAPIPIRPLPSLNAAERLALALHSAVVGAQL